MNNKLVIVLIGLIIIVLMVFGITTSNKNRNGFTDICDEIKSAKEDNNAFVIFIEGDQINDYLTTNLDDFKNEYPEVNIIRIKHNTIKKECFKKELNISNIYKNLESSTVSTLLFFVKDERKGIIIGDFSYEHLENYADEIGIIKKHEVQETTTLIDFKNNIQDEYILLLIGKEKSRSMVTKYASKYFKDYDYDIVYANSTKGNEIFNHVINNYKIGDMFPRALYFKKGKLLIDESVYDLDNEYKDYVTKINELNEKDS